MNEPANRMKERTNAGGSVRALANSVFTRVRARSRRRTSVCRCADTLARFVQSTVPTITRTRKRGWEEGREKGRNDRRNNRKGEKATERARRGARGREGEKEEERRALPVVCLDASVSPLRDGSVFIHKTR